MSFSGYARYREPNAGWLDLAPDHWIETRVKYIAPFQVGWTPPTKNSANFEGPNLWANISDIKGRNIVTTSKRISDEAAAAASMSVTPKGSLLYSFKLSVGAVGFATVDMYTNEAIASFLEESTLPLGYLYYAFQVFIIQNAATNIYGARILNQELIRNASVLAPPHEEAELIAKFLDHETARIDALIEKQQQLIALLKEKRQAVISHAVTKGLNPDAPMRDSGVEWLGEIPAHWKAMNLKHEAKVVDCKHLTAEFVNDGIPLASIGEVKGWLVTLGSAKRTTEKFWRELISGGRDPAHGDIIYTRNATVGEAALVGPGMPRFAMGQDVCLIRSSEGLNSEYLLHCLKSSVVRRQLNLAMVGSTFKRVNVDEIRNFSILLPPPEEQQEIVSELARSLPLHDQLLEAAKSCVELAVERRAALISAAVTGKIDVRNWKPPAPSSEKVTA